MFVKCVLNQLSIRHTAIYPSRPGVDIPIGHPRAITIAIGCKTRFVLLLWMLVDQLCNRCMSVCLMILDSVPSTRALASSRSNQSQSTTPGSNTADTAALRRHQLHNLFYLQYSLVQSRFENCTAFCNFLVEVFLWIAKSYRFVQIEQCTFYSIATNPVLRTTHCRCD